MLITKEKNKMRKIFGILIIVFSEGITIINKTDVNKVLNNMVIK